MSFAIPSPPQADADLLRDVLDGLDAAVTCYDRNDRLIYWNAAAATYFPKATNTLRPGTRIDERDRAKKAAGYLPMRQGFEGQAPALDVEEWNLPDGRRMLRRRVRAGLDRHIFVYLDVSDQFSEERKAIAALEAERERYALVLEGNREGIYDRDYRSETIWMSARAHEILGLPDGALNGDRGAYVALVHPDDRLAYETALRAKIGRKEPILTTLTRVRHADGGWRWIATRGRVVYGKDGTPVRSVGSMSDITEQKEAEDALRQSEERYAQLVDGTREGAFDLDFRGGTLWASARTHELLGLPEGALNESAYGFLRLVHPEDAGPLRERIARTYAGREPYADRLFRMRHGDGSWRWIRTRGRITYDDNGSPLRTVGSVGDVTEEYAIRESLRRANEDLERKVGERTAHLEREIAERRAAEEAVRAAEQRLSEIIDTMPIGVAVYDPEERMRIRNRWLDRRYPLQSSAIGSTLRERSEYGVRQFARGDGEAFDVSIEVERELHRVRSCQSSELNLSDGSVIRDQTVRLADGSLVRLQVDITDVKQAEKRLEAAINALDDSFALYDRDDRLAICNTAYRRELAAFGVDDLDGITVGNLLGRLWDAGRFTKRYPDRDAWIAERLHSHRLADGVPFEVTRANGTYRTRIFRTGTGETVRLTSDVTELRRTEDRIKRLFQLLPVGVIVHDDQGRVVDLNAAARRIYQYDENVPFLALPFQERVKQMRDGFILQHRDGRPYDDVEREAWIRERLESLRSGNPGPVELRTLTGRIVRLTSVRTDDGQLLQAHEDVTELRNAERRLATAVDAINDSFSLFDAGQRLVLCNQAYRRELSPISEQISYGMTFREITEMCWDSGIVASNEPRERWIAMRLRQHEEADGSAFEVRRGDRSLRVSEYRTRESETVRVGTDVTELRRAEDELKRLLAENRRLSDAEIAKRSHLLQAVMDTIPDGIVIVEDGGGAVFWNRAVMDMAEAESDLAVGRDRLKGLGLGKILEQLQMDEEAIRLLETGHRRLERALRDGRSLEIRLLPTGEGSKLLWTSDITRRRKDEAERMTLQERVLQSQKSEAIGVIAGTIAHDFNNLLTITLGFASLGQSQLELLEALPKRLPMTDPVGQRAAGHIANAAGSISRSLGNIVNAANRGKSIVANLTSFARSRPSALMVGDLATTVDAAGKLISASLPASAAFSIKMNAEGLSVRHDPVKVEQMLLNLCINSSHAMEGRTGSIAIAVGTLETDGGRASGLAAKADGDPSRARLVVVDHGGWVHHWRGILPQGRYVRIDVTDDGAGMEPDTLQKIFDPFFTTKASGKGTGLGIPSVDHIVAEHGGAIHIRSQVGRGTVFSLFLPLADTERGSTGAESPAPGAMPLDGDAQSVPVAAKGRVLVIDDEEHLVELMEMTLKRGGFAVDAFTDPDKALDFLRESASETLLIVTDQTMPKMTGTAVAARVAELYPTLPVILCTGYSAQAIDDRKLPAGVTAMLRKPFAPQDLVDAVRSAIDDRFPS